MAVVHQNARKINYYVRMLAKELQDEINSVIKSPASARRLTELMDFKADKPEVLANNLQNIHSIPDDDSLSSSLSKLLADLRNSALSKTLSTELSSRIRKQVPDGKVPWKVTFADYSPTTFTAWPVLHTTLEESSSKPPWADEDFVKKTPAELSKVRFNEQDELLGKKIDRRSREARYDTGPDGLPRNPRGRTGMRGRGLLGRFGPNLAADPIVSRWKKAEGGGVKTINGKRVLECVFIQRRDNHEWAIPGGMVEPGTEVSMTLIKEFREEALNVCNKNEDEAKKMTEDLKKSLFAKGITIYEGYVDDPRNTDNAWMETVAKNFHDESGVTYAFTLEGGDDAANSKWQECSSGLKLYASHTDFIERTAKLHNAYW